MPDIRIELQSQRSRPITDLVTEADFQGTHYVHPLDIKKGRGYVLADVVPGKYRVILRVDEFIRSSQTLSAKAGQKGTIQWTVQHRCTLLPDWADLSAEQKTLFSSYAGQQSPQALWDNLSDNEACTFFQISHVLTKTPIGGTQLSDYISKIRVIGGAEIEDRATEGGKRRAVGWRMHVTIAPKFRETIRKDLIQGGFKLDKGPIHPTHARFGYTKSFRQQGLPPWLQLVLKPAQKDASKYVEADVDLDVNPPLQVHNSSPHDVYPALKERFPEVSKIYRVE